MSRSAHLPEEQRGCRRDAALGDRDGREVARHLAGDLRDEEFCAAIVEKTDRRVRRSRHPGPQRRVPEGPRGDRGARDRASSTGCSARTSMRRCSPRAPRCRTSQPGASIIVTSSIQAFNPSPSLVDYAMTKAAQVAFVKALAEELGPKGIRVNAVAPGSDLDPAHPRDGMGCRAPRIVRPGHAARARRTAGRARRRLRVSGERRRLVRVGRGRARHRGKGSLTRDGRERTCPVDVDPT